MPELLLNILLGFQALLAMPILYLVMLTVLAHRAPRRTNLTGQAAARRFAFLIPAHNEEKLLPACLESLARLDYPRDLYDIHVVADNCTDSTATIATQRDAITHTRTNPNLRGKGYALESGLAKIWERDEESGRPYGGIIILDADTVVSENFLRVIEARMARGERIIQAFYTASQPERSWNESLRFAALAAVHYLRPQARMVFGGSCGLKGNGMAFAPEILKAHAWSAGLTEDIEYHMALVLAGERVTFAPDAVVRGEMPTSLKNAQSQHDRWERGRLQAALKYPPLLASAAAREAGQGKTGRAALLLDAAAEHLIPPLSILAGLSAAGWAASVTAWAVTRGQPQTKPARKARANLALSSALLAGMASYVFFSLRLARAPRAVYQALLYAPILVAWKLAQYVRVLTNRNTQSWVRTTRNERES